MKKAVALIALLAALAIGLAACGSDDSDDAAVTEEAPMEEPAGNGEMTEEPAEAMTEAPDIVTLAQDTPDLSTLVDAVVAADLVETLQGEGPFTVFAPTNDAFAALGGDLDTLLEPANQDQLAAILTYHVVPGEVMSTDLTDGQQAETVQGEMLEIGVTDEGVTVNGANVVMADVEASNGVVHVIDGVLTPPGT